MNDEIRGDRTGRIWTYHLTKDLVGGVRGTGPRYRGTASDDGSLAWIHLLEKGSYWDADIERLRQAIAVADHPEIAASRTIIRLLDVRETETVSGDFGYSGVLTAIWEWADVSLHDWLTTADAPGDVADEIESNIRDALALIHALGLTHLDVAPNNILRVEGRWKLADLDLCAPIGTPLSDRHPPAAYRHPERAVGVEARAEFDLYGLDQVLRDLRLQGA